jgi:hypothetical protein
LSAAPALATATPETPLTLPVTTFTGTTATFEGEPNPATPETVGYEFHFNNNGSCEGNTVGGVPPATLIKATKVSTPVKDLEGSTEYTVCLFVFNEALETATSAPVKFKTPAAKPVIPSESASVTPVGATLEAKVNPENQATKYELEYAGSKEKLEKDEEVTVLTEGLIPGVAEEQPVGPVETGAVLTPSTTYYYRIVATNGTGTEDGKVESFTTATAVEPSIDAESVTGVTRTNAILHAAIDPEYQETEYQFKLGTTPAYGLDAPAALTGLGGLGFLGDIEREANLNGESVTLEPNTEYHYEAIATNATGTSAPGDQKFLTLPDPPTVSTGVAFALTPTTATIPAEVNPDAGGHIAQDDTTYYVEYGGTAAYGKQTTFPAGDAVEACRLLVLEGKECAQGVAIAGEGVGAKAETVNLSGLEPGVTYHYRVVATNLNDANELHGSVYGETLQPQTVYGADATFTTPGTPPILSGVSVQGVTQTGATISATLEAQNLPTRWELQLGSTPGLLAPVSSGTATVTTPLSLPVQSLSPGTLYYYRITATNPDGSSGPEGEGSFTTAPAPAAAAPTGLPATIPYTTIAQYEAKEPKEVKTVITTTKPTKCKKGFTKKHNKCMRVKKKKGKKK